MNQPGKRSLFFVSLLFIQAACSLLGKESPPPTENVAAQMETSVFELASPVAIPATQRPASLPSSVPEMIASPAVARRYLEGLLQTGPRPPGSAEEQEAATYIEDAFEEMGYPVERQAFSFMTDEGEYLHSANLMVVKAGSSERELVVGAHYDSGDEAVGADDNASGLAVLLAAANLIKNMDTVYTIRLIAFGAEENNLDGSRFYVSHLSTADLQKILYMINLDSLIAGDKPYLYGTAGGPGDLRSWIDSEARLTGFEVQVMDVSQLDYEDGSPCECADYAAFQEAGIDFMYFESTNWSLGDLDGMTQVDPSVGDNGVIRHTEYDTLDYIDRSFPGRVDRQLNGYAALLVNILTRFNPSR